MEINNSESLIGSFFGFPSDFMLFLCLLIIWEFYIALAILSWFLLRVKVFEAYRCGPIELVDVSI